MSTLTLDPGVEQIPIYQEGSEEESYQRSMEDSVGFHVRAFRSAGPIYRTTHQGKSTLYLAGQESNDFVWKSTDLWTYHNIAAAFREELGDDHVTAIDGAHHRQKRTILKPAFDMGSVMRFLPQFNTIFREELSQTPAMGKIEFVHFWSRTLVKTHSKTISQVEIAEELIDKVTIWEKLFIAGLLLGDKRHAYYADPEYRALKSAALTLLGEMVDARLADPDKYQDNSTPVLEARKKETEGPMDRNILIDDIYFILLAGVENTARFMNLCLVKILEDPAWLAEIREEVDGWDGQDVMALTRMARLKATILEVQRYHPLVLFNFRQAAKDFEYGGYHVPAGTMLIHAHSTCHYLEEFYPDPFEFKPSRFIEEGRFVAKTNGFFGGGTHICLGRNYTMLQTPIALAQTLKYYDVELEKDSISSKLKIGTALKEQWVKVSPRKS